MARSIDRIGATPTKRLHQKQKKQGFGKQLWLLQTRFLCPPQARPSPAVTTRNSDFVQNRCPCSDYGGSVHAILFLICPTFGADLPLGLGRPLLFAGYAAGPDDAGLWWAVPPRATHIRIQPLCPRRTVWLTLGALALAGHHLRACHSGHLPQHFAGPAQPRTSACGPIRTLGPVLLSGLSTQQLVGAVPGAASLF